MTTMEVMSSSSMDNSFSSSHEAEGKNVATYYFRHESGDSECETSSDEGMGRSMAALNYSREDIQALATQAELMVLGRIENRREIPVEDGDSDYSSNHPLSPLVSSEPNLQRRTSPKRRVLNSRRRDWRNSLPECLEFYHHGQVGGQQNNRSLRNSVSNGGERAASSSPHKQHQPAFMFTVWPKWLQMIFPVEAHRVLSPPSWQHRDQNRIILRLQFQRWRTNRPTLSNRTFVTLLLAAIVTL